MLFDMETHIRYHEDSDTSKMFKSVILLYYNNTINIENFILQISREYQFAISKAYLNNFNEKKYQLITTCEKDSKDELPISKIIKTFRRMYISRANSVVFVSTLYRVRDQFTPRRLSDNCQPTSFLARRYTNYIMQHVTRQAAL